MKKYIKYIAIAYLGLLSCKSQKKSAFIEKSCENNIYLESGLSEIFNFQNRYKGNFQKSFLLDTLFKGFNVSEGIMNIEKSINYHQEFLEFTKAYNPDIDQDFSKLKRNTFVFYKVKERGYVLESAEINFSNDLVFSKEQGELYKIILQSNYSLDIGTNKNDIKTILNLNNKILCDTLQIQDDLQSIWIYFKNNKIDKFVPQIYMHN